MQRRGKFDYILLETTGLADPGAVASMFWVDSELGVTFFLKVLCLLLMQSMDCGIQKKK
ncbi:hypothetical protein Nmel_008183 [Mimus melanotis]